MEVESLAIQKSMLYLVPKDVHVIEQIKIVNELLKVNKHRRNVLSRVMPTDIVAVQTPTHKVSVDPAVYYKEMEVCSLI